MLDNYKAGQIAASHLLELGHTVFACITGNLNITLARERMNGFRDFLLQAKIPEESIHVLEGDFSFESGITAVRRIVDEALPCTAVWAQYDLTAVGALKELTRLGIRVPEDMSLVGMDGIDISRMVTPELTTINQPIEEMGKKSVELILKLICGERVPERTILLPQLIIRGSTGRAHAKVGETD